MEKIIILKNDRVGDLFVSLSAINLILNKHQDKEIHIYLSKLNYKCKMHFRIMQLNRKKRLKKFFNIINDLFKKKKLFKDIFIYTENIFQKEKIKELTNLDVEIFYNNLTFSKRNLK